MPDIPDLFDLRQKVALVTGAAMGIGARTAERLAQAGACVAVADVDVEGATRVAEGIRASGAISAAFPCDVGKTADIGRTVQVVVKELGRLDILVNNAGIFPMSSALDVTEQTWDRVLAVNLKGAFFLAQRAASQMIDQGQGGSIVNVASIDGLHPAGRFVHYDASKAGLVMMTRSLALELGPRRVRVNAVAPGAMRTPGTDNALGAIAGATGAGQLRAQLSSRIPLGRMGEPDDVARAVLFLVSRAADYVTGSTLVVDGGMLLT
jgi:NAD(P)-dependent dehydrogenase (short-subunit alcohol dehydrogenase family)